jgi:hypothetical protein
MQERIDLDAVTVRVGFAHQPHMWRSAEPTLPKVRCSIKRSR